MHVKEAGGLQDRPTKDSHWTNHLLNLSTCTSIRLRCRVQGREARPLQEDWERFENPRGSIAMWNRVWEAQHDSFDFGMRALLTSEWISKAEESSPEMNGMSSGEGRAEPQHRGSRRRLKHLLGKRAREMDFEEQKKEKSTRSG